MKYYAKSNPKETIQEHTDNLLKEYSRLKNIYPNINVNWDLLKLACMYHDFGKINKKFQYKIGNDLVKLSREEKNEKEIPHGILSIAFINTKSLKEEGYTSADLKILINTIAYHHERKFNIGEENELLNKEIESMKEFSKDFSYLKRDDYYKDLNNKSLRRINKSRVQRSDGLENYDQYIMIKGLLNKIDYAASSYEDVEIKNDYLMNSLNKMVEEVWSTKNKKAEFNTLQKYAFKNQEENLILIAETGMGKTEAGLLWIGDNKGFFTLPLKSAINAIYDRIRLDIVKNDIENKLGLLHSDVVGEILYRQELDSDKLELKSMTIDKYNTKTRNLSMPLTISTIDQIFDFVYQYGGSEIKLATLSYSKIVIDEIQMYSSDLISYLVLGLNEINRLGGKFAIITATFPPFIGELLEKEGIKFRKPEPFLDENRIRHSYKIIEEEINAKFIYEKYNKNKVLVIVNTVKEAQRLYEELKEEYDLDEEEINLFHSGFIKKDRKDKENNIMEFGKKSDENNKNYNTGIWICTQVAEASLDIDFDILITELSDVNGLFQRMGRCYRSRSLDKDYNIFVFDGGENKTSGIGHVIDEDIFIYSKEELRKQGNGKISEKDKIDMINRIYTSEKLKNTKYLNDIKETINYISNIRSYEMKKNDAKQLFRDINSITVIPEIVYEENIIEIENAIEKIQEKTNSKLEKEEVEKLRIEKIKARNTINNYSISIPFYKVNSKNTDYKKINDYEEIVIYKCKYDKFIGINHVEIDVEKGNNCF